MIPMRLMRGAVGMSHSVVPATNIFASSFLSDQDDVTGMRNGNLFAPFRQAAILSTSRSLRMSPQMLEVEAQLPVKPKRPVTPWLAFLHERKDETIFKNGPMTAAQLAVVLSKEWQTVDKARYEQDYQQKQKEYRFALESYENSLTDEHRAVIKHQKNLQQESKDLRKLRSTKPPTLPRNPISLYCAERCKDPDVKEQMKARKSAMVLRDLSREYKNLSESAKERYLAMQQKDRLRFQHEFNQWYNGVKSDPNLPKTILEKANTLRARFEALDYI